MEGPNKLLLPFMDHSVLTTTFMALTESKVSEVILVANEDLDIFHTFLEFNETDVLVFNPDYEQGMTTSIQAGIKAAKGDAYMICLGDMPWLTTAHYNALIEQYSTSGTSSGFNIVYPNANERRGNPVIFPGDLHTLGERVSDGCLCASRRPYGRDPCSPLGQVLPRRHVCAICAG